MVKINLQVLMLFLVSFVLILYMIDIWIPIVYVSMFKSVLYFILASTIVAQAFAVIFDRDNKDKKKKRNN